MYDVTLLKLLIIFVDILPYIVLFLFPYLAYRKLNEKKLEDKLNSKHPISLAVLLGIFFISASFINNESDYVSSAGLFIASIILAFFIVSFQDFLNLKTNQRIEEIHQKLFGIESNHLNEIPNKELDSTEIQRLEEDIFLKQRLVTYYKLQLLEEDIIKKKIKVNKLRNKQKKNE